MANIVAEFANEDGVASLVFEVTAGYRVALVDTDAGETVPVFTTYPAHRKQGAIDYAKSLVA